MCQITSFDKLREIVNNLQELSDQTVTEMLLYGTTNLKGNQNKQILKCSYRNIKKTIKEEVSCRLILSTTNTLKVCAILKFMIKSTFI